MTSGIRSALTLGSKTCCSAWGCRSNCEFSGLPVDIFDPTGGRSLRVVWRVSELGARGTRESREGQCTGRLLLQSISFLPPAVVQPGQPIPSVRDPMAVVDPAAEAATDIGNVGRNVLRGPKQLPPCSEHARAQPFRLSGESNYPTFV